jgi:hypothetical protein
MSLILATFDGAAPVPKPLWFEYAGVQMIATDSPYDFPVFMRSSVSPCYGVPGATLSLFLKKAGGVFSAITRTVTDLGAGAYSVALLAGDTDTDGALVLKATASGCNDTFVVAQVGTAAGGGGSLTTAEHNQLMATLTVPKFMGLS